MGDHLIGVIGAIGMGVITVGAIYQLGKQSNPTVGDVTTLGTNTLNGLFKG